MSDIDILIAMDKLQSFMESGICEVYSKKDANKIAKHLKAHGYQCKVEYRKTPICELWIIKKTEESK